MQTLARIILWSLCLALSGTHAADEAAQEPPFEFRPGQTDQFAGAQCVMRISSPAAGLPPVVIWRLSVEQRTLAQGKSVLKPVDNAADDSTFELQTPEIQNGVVLKATLSCRLGDSEPTVDFPLRLRGPNPFHVVQETLKQSGIAVFDPLGATAEALKELEVPVEVVTSLSDTEEAQLVIIGEGVPWDEGLVEEAEKLAQQGKFLLVLRPQAESVWPLPLSAEGVSQFRFNQLADVQRTAGGPVPQTLDVQFWDAEQTTRPGWALRIENEKLLLTPGKGSQVWQMAEYHTVQKGRCVFLGVPVMADWKSSPVPRELLAGIFTSHLTIQAATTAAAEAH